MKKYILIPLLIIIFLPSVSAKCNNTAIFLVHGLYSTTDDPEWQTPKKLIFDKFSKDSVYEFNYNQRYHLDQLQSQFLSFIKSNTHNYEAIMILGHSAGGVIASKTAGEIDVNIPVQIYTVASPIAGYAFVGGDLSAFLNPIRHIMRIISGNLIGDIVRGIPEYKKPKENVQVIHYKTGIDDAILTLYGWLDPFVSQQNSVPGAKELFTFVDHSYALSLATNEIVNAYSC